MEFCLLGPLTVSAGTAAVPVPPGKQRAVLAALLVAANRVVSLDELGEVLWGSDPPPSARVAIQNHVMRLRKTMGDEGSRVVTQPPGYLIRVTPGELDITRAHAYLDSARTAARDGSWDAAATEAQAALSLFRGEPLADVDSEALTRRLIPRLAELRLQALEARIDADLHLGRHAEVITELRQLTGAHSLRERLHGQLMLALYHDGRQAEALSAYQDARKVLVEEIGAEPGAELRELHRQILTNDPAAAVPERAPDAEDQTTGRVVPRELPALAAHYVGRAAEHAYLTGLLDQRGEPTPGTLVISAIGGTAGVGKTALAVHWAHQAAEQFPDGQLYVNLRGYDPAQPVPATDVLARFLRSLGEPGQHIPREEDERAARYRSLLAGKRMLIILDNAGSADQVRPLLPGNPACRVIVTSRDALAGLVARDGATRLDVDALPLEDAVALLRALIGARVDAEPAAAAELAGQCCRLPLALRVAAELAADRPAMPLAGLVDELADLRTRLDLLEADGDPSTGMRAVFSWSYRHLHNEDARTSRLLGLHPGPDIEAYAAAALTGMTVRQAHRALDVLARAHLLCRTPSSRHGMHDLLRAYARELTATLDTEQEQHAALTRLFDHYLYTAATAMDTLFPAERNRRPRIPRPATPVPPLADPAAAREWLDSERATLMAAVAYTADHDWPAHATRLAATLFRYLYSGDHLPEALTVSSHALSTARRTGDLTAEATALSQIGSVDGQQGRLRKAAEHHWRALALLRAAGDRAGEAHALGNLGLPEPALGRYKQAARHQQEALAVSHDIGDRQGEGNTLGRLGAIDLRLSRYQRAAGYFQQALALFREMGDASGEAEGLISLGEVYLRLGRYEQAAGNFEHALAMSRELSDRVLQANAHSGLARTYQAGGDSLQARHHWQEALTCYTAIGAPEALEIRARLADDGHQPPVEDDGTTATSPR